MNRVDLPIILTVAGMIAVPVAVAQVHMRPNADKRQKSANYCVSFTLPWLPDGKLCFERNPDGVLTVRCADEEVAAMFRVPMCRVL